MSEWNPKAERLTSPSSPSQPPASKPYSVPTKSSLAPSREAQQLWFATERRKWSSLAVIPIGDGLTARAVARQLSDVSAVHHLDRLEILDVTKAELQDISAVLAAIAIETRDGGRVVLAMSSLEQVLAGLPIARAVDAVLLCVELGRSNLDAARRTVAMLGPEKIIGCVAVEEEGLPK